MGGSGLTGGGQVRGGLPFGAFCVGFGAGRFMFSGSLFGVGPGRSLAALLAQATALLRRGNKHRRLLGLGLLAGHSPSPRDCLTAATPGCSNHDPSGTAFIASA